MDIKFNIYYAVSPNGPWILANPNPLDEVPEGNQYTITGVQGHKKYFVRIIGGYLEDGEFVPLVSQPVRSINIGASSTPSNLEPYTELETLTPQIPGEGTLSHWFVMGWAEDSTPLTHEFEPTSITKDSLLTHMANINGLLSESPIMHEIAISGIAISEILTMTFEVLSNSITLPVIQQFDATTYSVNSYQTWVPYLTIPASSFTAGHRYLIIAHIDVRSYYDGAYHEVNLRLKWNGTDINSNCPIMRNTSGWCAVPFMEVYTAPGSGVGGLQIGAYYVNGIGGEIKNQRLVAIDLDIDNAKFPQQSANGWRYAAVEGNQTLTTSWASYVTLPTFTPDGSSDYLIIACGNIFSVGNQGRGAIGIGVDGIPSIGSYLHGGAYSSNLGTILCSYITRLPNAPVSLSLMGYKTGALGLPTLRTAHLIAIRLKTFTKYAGKQWSFIPQTTGTSWQSVFSVSPLPSPAAGENFLVLSRIQGITWQSADPSFSERILRNPGGAEAISGSTQSLGWETNDYLGPTLCKLDTVSGVQTYELQFKRDNYSDRPGTFYNATLAAMKADVAYVASTAKYVPFLVSSIASSSDLSESPTWTTYTSIPGYKLVSGHRYLVFQTLQQYVQGTGTLQARSRLLMNGTEITGSRHQESHTATGYYTPAASIALVTGTGTGNGIEIQGQKLGASNAQNRYMRLLAIDLDADATKLPPQSDAGWRYAEILTPVANGSSYATVHSLSFTPDGTSDYLVIGDVELYSDVAGSGEGNVRLLNGSNGIFGTAYETYSYTDGATAEMRTHFPIVYRFAAPAASLITLNLQARRTGTAYPYVASARLFVLRLNCFATYGVQYNASNRSNVFSDTWDDILPAVTPSVAPEVNENMLLLAAWQMNWTSTQPTWEQDYRFMESNIEESVFTDFNIYGSQAADYKGMLAIIRKGVLIENTTYKLQDKNPAGVGNATSMRHRLLITLGAKLA